MEPLPSEEHRKVTEEAFRLVNGAPVVICDRREYWGTQYAFTFSEFTGRSQGSMVSARPQCDPVTETSFYAPIH